MMKHEELTNEIIEEILEEISAFTVDLEEDPTLPNLRHKYLHKVLSQCRNYLNRVQSYLEVIRKRTRSIRLDVKERELDINFKSQRLLADDGDVRMMPNIKDREALVMSKLVTEYDEIGKKKLELLHIEETEKIIKHKYDHLRSTNGDIKTQRQMVKDELGATFDGIYNPPSLDGSLPNGVPPLATVALIEPSDLLNDSSRPEDLPKPIDKIHADQLAAFYNRTGNRENAARNSAEKKKSEEKEKKKSEEKEKVSGINYSALLED